MADKKLDIEQLREILKLQEDTSDSLEKELALEKEINKTLDDRNKKLLSDKKIRELELDLEYKYKDIIDEKLKDAIQEIKHFEEILNNEEKRKQLTEEQLELIKQSVVEEQKKVDFVTQGYNANLKHIEQLEEQNKKLSEAEDAILGMEENTKSFFSVTMGISDKWKDTFFGKLAVATGTKGLGGLGQALTNIGKGLKSALTPANLLGSTLLKMQESTINLVREQDNALSSFNASTGAAGEYNDLIRKVGISNLELGIDTADAAQATEALISNLSMFTGLGRESQEELITLSATMAEFGVSNEVTARNLEITTKYLGMNVKQSVQAQKEIVSTASALGFNTAKLVQDFSNATPRIAAFGDKAVDVFKELAGVSRATGIEMNDLLNITERFDTFEGAAGAAGKLNSILGGNLIDSMQLIQTTDPTERMRMLRNAVLNTGQSFDSMSYYQRKAIASAAGLKDVGQLQQLLADGWEENVEKAKAAEASDRKLAETAEKAQGVFKNLKNIINSFAISLGPLVDMVSSAMTWFLKLNKTMGGYLVPTIVGVLGGFVLLNKTIPMTMGLISKLWFVIKGGGGVLKSVTLGFVSFGKSAFNALMSIPSLAKSAVGGLKGIYSSLKQLSARKMWDSIKSGFSSIGGFLKGKKEVPVPGGDMKKMMDAMGGSRMIKQTEDIGKSMDSVGQKTSKLGKIASLSTTQILALGAAFLMLGAGVALVIGSLVLLANVIKGMTIKEFLILSGIFVLVIGGLIGLTAALIAIVTPAVAAGVPLIALGVAFLMIGGAIAIVSLGIAAIIVSFTSLFKTLQEGGTEILPIIVPQIVNLGLGLVAIGTGGVLAGIGLGATAIGFTALAVSLALIKTKDLQAVSLMFLGISNITSSTVTALNSVTTSIKNISKAVDEMPTDKTITFATLMGSIDAIPTIETKAVENVKRLVDQAVRYKETQEISKKETTSSFMDFLKSSSNLGGNMSGKGGDIHLHVELGGKRLNDYIINIMNGEIDPRRA